MGVHTSVRRGHDCEGHNRGTLIRRAPQGWRVDGTEEQLPDLLNAMILADLLAGGTPPTDLPTPPRATPDSSETERLRVTVQQLEHALRTRVVVEQAIGVLAERHRIAPRTAFERLRRAARFRGKKVAALAHEVVESTRNPLVALPEELAREGSAVQAWPPKRAS
ncbi:MAG: ANTAR domain-containing protein [Thermobifida fusca]|uniref:ANTAR domain-containing protein n=1 Tax=Thermobifida TaxID=83677 RepID=UPI000CEE2B30|nr:MULTISPECIES: ANTAR domain-containing protein [Thermobifida]MBO2529571.1 antitermination regulator [Thermobifida sp.]PPS93389.1 antitermination regulator [Thermobifida fusca]PZN65526.1 MAG: ANTAR domain-containing protein [Thermobifida fusca]QOS60105.1 ANTAR domain-containing protein [Thermobifida fusca]